MSRKACYIFSSSPSQGALNIRDDGSRFSVQMNYPPYIPNYNVLYYAILHYLRLRSAGVSEAGSLAETDKRLAGTLNS